MRKMKKLTTGLLLMSMILSLGACGSDSTKDKEDKKDSGNKTEDASSTEDQVAGGEEVTVNVLQYKIEIEDELKAAADRYHELYPNVTIKIDSEGGTGSVDTTYKSKAAAGEMPDIFNCTGPDSCATYADYLEDLSDQPWVEHANAGMLDLDKIDGKYYGMPVTTEGMGLIANKAMFEAAGIDISTLDSYDKIDEAFAKLQKAIDNGDLKDQFPNLENVVAV